MVRFRLQRYVAQQTSAMLDGMTHPVLVPLNGECLPCRIQGERRSGNISGAKMRE